MNLLNLLASGSYITVNKELIKEVGIEAAILFGELASEALYWQERNENDCFFSTVENIEDKTTLNDYQQRKAIKVLKDKGLIECKVKGIPAKRYFEIHEDKLFELLKINFSKNSSHSSEKFKELDAEIFQSNKNINNNNIEKEYNNNIDESSMKRDSFESQHNEKKHTSVDYEAEFEKLWSLYPCKRGKSQVSKKAKKELAKAGYDVVSKAIENYKKEVEDIRQNSFNQQWLNGSTFFNGRWKDYVTANDSTFPDGRKEVEYEDGSKIIYFPNGKVLDVDPYGLSHELLPHEIEELKEGRYK